MIKERLLANAILFVRCNCGLRKSGGGWIKVCLRNYFLSNEGGPSWIRLAALRLKPKQIAKTGSVHPVHTFRTILFAVIVATKQANLHVTCRVYLLQQYYYHHQAKTNNLLNQCAFQFSQTLIRLTRQFNK